MKVDFKAIKLGSSQLIVLNQGKKYVKRALPEIITALYEEAKQLHAAQDNEKAIKKYLARINPDYRITTDGGIFERDDTGKYYLKGYPVVVPDNLLEAIRARIRAEADFQYLIEFWKLLMINPEPVVRNHLFDLCKGGEDGLEITTNGYLLGYVRCELNHDIKALETFLRKAAKADGDRQVYRSVHGNYSFNDGYGAYPVGQVSHLKRDLFKDAFSRLREAQSVVFRYHSEPVKQLQVGEVCHHTVLTTGRTINPDSLPNSAIVLMVLFNPAHVDAIDSNGVKTLECFPYGAVQAINSEFTIVGETLMEFDYLQQDYYSMQNLLLEAREIIGDHTVQLSPKDIKRILDSRTIYLNKFDKE